MRRIVTAIKICGLSTPETLEAAIAGGATHVGLVHYQPSPRHLTLAAAAKLRVQAGTRASVALLIVNLDGAALAEAVAVVRPDIVQLHGVETPDHATNIRTRHDVAVWKALGITDDSALHAAQRYAGSVDLLLYDAPPHTLPGGNGEAFDWEVLAGFDHRVPWGLAGGLTPANVAQAIAQTGAPLVDVSSGVESAPGVKDVDLIAAFCKAARSAGTPT